MSNLASNNQLTAASFEVATNEINNEFQAVFFSPNEITQKQLQLELQAKIEKTSGVFKVETWYFDSNGDAKKFITTEIATNYNNFKKAYQNWYAKDFSDLGFCCLRFLELNDNSEKILFFDFCTYFDIETGITTFMATDPTIPTDEDGILERDNEVCVGSNELENSVYQFLGSDEILEKNAIEYEKYLSRVRYDEYVDGEISRLRM
jgi:hypothetical protein